MRQQRWASAVAASTIALLAGCAASDPSDAAAEETPPCAEIEAFADHGAVKSTVTAGLDDAQRTLAELEALGISLPEVTDKLLVDGLSSFQKSYDQVIVGLEKKVSSLVEA
jgi:transaldolase